MLQTEPGRALRAWTEIDQDVTDRGPVGGAVAELSEWWLTSERVGNYQNGRTSHPGRC